MSKPKLTIGMPTYEDFDGVWFTVQSLCMHHAEVMRDVEIIVVNDGPMNATANAVRGLIQNAAGKKCHSMKFLHHANTLGPAMAKNDVFLHAAADHVLCMDCHILYPPGTIRRLIEYFALHPESMDLFCGPNVLDDFETIQTELVPAWRGQAWGTWHSNPAGNHPNNPPYEIWANGCGVMACKKFAWVGFNPHFRGFGAEEGYIHEKFRKVGRKVINLPFLRWVHRYEHPGGPKFPIIKEVKIRNYVLGFLELGFDLDDIYNHFVSLGHEGETLQEHLTREHSVDQRSFIEPDGKPVSYDKLQQLHKTFKIPEENWRFLMKDPINHYHPDTLKGKEDGSGFMVDMETREAAIKRVLSTHNDVNQHLPKLIELAKQCDTVEEITRRHETTIALAVAAPKKLRSRLYGFGVDDKMKRQIVYLVPPETEFDFVTSEKYEPTWDIEECDMFFYKCPHNYHDLQVDLPRWAEKVKRFIVIHDTQAHGAKWEGEIGPGLSAGMKDLVDTGKWFVAYHSGEQWGLTVLGCQDRDRPGIVIHAWPPGFGPGTEMKAIWDVAKVVEKVDCTCTQIRLEMDVLGVEGCKAHRGRLVGMIQDNAKNWNIKEKVEAMARLSVSSEWKLPWKLDIVDIYGSMFDIAVQRAEAKQNAKI